jgi:hypothetical protein
VALDPQSPDMPACPDAQHPSLGHAAAPRAARAAALPDDAEPAGEVA